MYNLKKAKINQNFPITIINAKEQKAFFGVDGKSEQETRSGKNLASDVFNEYSLTPGPYGYKKLIDSFTKTYLVASLIDNDTSVDMSGIYLGFTASGNNYTEGVTWLIQDGTKKDNYYTNNKPYLSFFPTNTTTFNKIFQRYKIQIELSDTLTPTSYEPYGASPSPDYPSEIHSVADDVNLFDKETELITYGYISSYEYSNGIYTIIPTGTGNPQIRLKFILPAGTYTLNSEAYLSIATILRNNNGLLNNFQAEYQNQTFTTTETSAELVFNWTNPNNTNPITLDLRTLKIQKGTTSTPYSPYNQGTVTIKQRGKNLFDKEAVAITSGGTKTVLGTGIRVSLSSSGTFRSCGIEIGKEELLGKTLTVYSEITPSSNNNGAIFLYYGNSSNMAVSNAYANITSTGSLTKTLVSEFPTNCDRVYALFYGNRNGTGNIDDYVDYTNVQIEEGSTATPYEPYQTPHDYTIQTEPLRSLPNGVKDTIEEDGIHRRVGRGIIDGTKNWSLASEGNTTDGVSIYGTPFSNIKVSANKGLLCDYFEFLPRNELRNSSLNFITGGGGNAIVLNINNSYLSTLDVAGFKSWLNNNPIEVLYELAEEIIEPFTEEQQEVVNSMKTFEGTNIFDLQQNIDTSATIEYREKITEEIKNAVINNAEKAYIEVLDTGEIFDETEHLKTVKLNDERYVEGRGFIGSVIAKELTGSFINDNDFFKNIENKEIKYYNGPVMGDDSVKYFDYGTFIVQKPENDNVKDDTSFVAFDYMIKFNKKFENRLDYSTGTVTVLQLLEDICDQVDVKLGTKTFRNSDFIIENNQFVGGETCREVLSQIAQIAFSWARIDENDELVLDFNPTEIISETLNPDDYFDLELNEVFGPVNTIAFSNSKVTGEYVAIFSDDYSPQEDEQIAIDIQDNYFAYTEDKRKQLLEAARPLLGLSYTPLKIKTCGRNYLNCLDKIKINNVQDVPYETYIFNNTLDFNGTTFDEKKSPSITKVEQEFSFTGEYEGAIRRTETIVDKANGTIADYIQKVDGAVTELAEIKRDINGLSVSLGKSGGNNLLYYDTEFWRLTIYDILYRGFEDFSSITETSINTLLDTTITEYNEEEERISFVYENHNIEINQIKNPPVGEKDFSVRTNPFLEKIKSSNSIQEAEGIYTYDDIRKSTLSGLGYYLRQEKVEQEVTVPNGVYTLSFLYKTLDPGATTKVLVDNGETEQQYILTSNTDSFKEFQLSREAIDEDISLIESTIKNAPSFDGITSQYLEDNLGTTISGYVKTDSQISFSAFNVDYIITQKINLKNTEGTYVTEINEILETVEDFDTITENFLNTSLGVTITNYEKQSYLISFNIEEENYIILLELEIHSDSIKYNYLTINVSTNFLRIKFETNLDRSVMIADLMLNSGSDKLDWTQNANETLTDTVTIGKGIVIESETDDVKFKADTDGIRIVKKDDEEDESARFTNLGTETKNIEVKNTSNLGGLIVRKVSSKKIWILLGND